MGRGAGVMLTYGDPDKFDGCRALNRRVCEQIWPTDLMTLDSKIDMDRQQELGMLFLRQDLPS